MSVWSSRSARVPFRALRSLAALVRRRCRLQQRLLPHDRESLGLQAAGFARQPGSNEVTGSVRQQAAPTAPGRELSRCRRADLRRRLGRHRQSAASRRRAAQRPITGSVAAPPPRQPAQNWSWDGGTAIIVAQGETIDTISRRHGVPAAAIMQANNMTHAGAAAARPAAGHSARAASAERGAASRRRPQTRVAGPAPSPRRQAARTSSRPARRSTRSRATIASRRWRSPRPTISASTIA